LPKNSLAGSLVSRGITVYLVEFFVLSLAVQLITIGL